MDTPTLTLGLLCLSEVVADDTPAVQAVLKADTRRLRLLEEEKRLQARLDKGEDNVSEELEKVCTRGLTVIRFHQSESPLRRAGFTLALLDV